MLKKATTLGCVLIPLMGCASAPGPRIDEASFAAQPTIACPGFNKRYFSRAITWSQSGDDTWVRGPFHFVNVFDVDVFGHIKSETKSVVMEYDGNQSLVRLRLLSSSDAQLGAVHVHGKLVECNPKEAVILRDERIYADGARETVRNKTRISDVGGKILVQTNVERYSSLLILTETRRRAYSAEFSESK